MNRIILVGRHSPNWGTDKTESDFNLEIVSQENILFSEDFIEVKKQLRELIKLAQENNACLVFQAFPVIVALALARIVAEYTQDFETWYHTHQGDKPKDLPEFGAIVAKQNLSDRIAGKIVEITFPVMGFSILSPLLEKLIVEINPSVKYTWDGTTIRLEFDPLKLFVFSHIEWVRF